MWSEGKSKHIYTFGDLRSDLEMWRQGKVTLEKVAKSVSNMSSTELEAGRNYLAASLGKVPWSEEEVGVFLRRHISEKPTSTKVNQRYRHMLRRSCSTMDKMHHPLWYGYHTGQIPHIFSRTPSLELKWMLTDGDCHQSAARAARRIFWEVAEGLSGHEDPVIAASFDTTGLKDWFEGRPAAFPDRSIWYVLSTNQPFSPDHMRIYRIRRKASGRSEGLMQVYLTGYRSRYYEVPIVDEFRQLWSFLQIKKPSTYAKKVSSILRFYHPCESIFAEEIATSLRPMYEP